MSPFRCEAGKPSHADDFVFEVPPGLKSKPELLNAFAKGLKFPAYFGNNWDAFEECLGDLSWLKAERVVIRFQDVPKLSPEDLKIFFDVLREHVKQPSGVKLEAAFPADRRKEVETLCRKKSK